MSAASMAVETIVVAELQDLFAAESALTQIFNHLRIAPDAKKSAGFFLSRLTDLEARAKRLERLLDAMDYHEGRQATTAIC
jgi:uncharacterized protein YdeI (YjbR/CyaY-like superfamily)